MTPPRRGRPPKGKQPTAKYDAAGSGRRIANWSPPSSGPNKALVGHNKIRARANDAVRNDWSGEASVQKWTTNLVGTGIVPRWDDDDLTKLWGKWGRVADADGVLDVYGLQALGIRGWLASGEVFLRRRPRVLGTKLPVPVQVQLIESDFCPVFDALQWPGMPSGNKIKQGIEVNRSGQRIAYWMHREHPGDGLAAPNTNDLIRVPAADIAHVFEPKRSGQMRGVTSLAPVLVRIRSAGDLEDTVLDRQKLANLFTLFITRALPEKWDGLDINPDTGLPVMWDTDGTPMATLEPGLAQELKPGEDIKFANPPEAGVTFSDYLRSTHLGTSAGQGLPYEVMSGDIRNVSDRTLRIVVQEFRRFAEQRQWHVAIPMMCQRMVEWWADAGALSGAIPLSKLDLAKNPEHSPHGWDYIHPVQDVQGKVLAINAGLTSRARTIRGRGEDPKQIDAERAADKEREDKLGLTPVDPGDLADEDDDEAAPPATAKPSPGKGKPAPKNELAEVLQTVVQTMGLMQSMMQNMLAMQTAAASAPAAQPVAHAAPSFVVHNHLPESAPVVNVAAPNVSVEPPAITIEPTVVNVAAPNVSVEPPVVHVAAPAVSVVNEVQPAAVEVNLPNRQTTSTIKRDGKGDIVDVTQIERTIN